MNSYGEKYIDLFRKKIRKREWGDLNEVNDEAGSEEEKAQWDDHNCSQSQRIPEIVVCR